MKTPPFDLRHFQSCHRIVVDQQSHHLGFLPQVGDAEHARQPQPVMANIKWLYLVVDGEPDLYQLSILDQFLTNAQSEKILTVLAHHLSDVRSWLESRPFHGSLYLELHDISSSLDAVSAQARHDLDAWTQGYLGVDYRFCVEHS